MTDDLDGSQQPRKRPFIALGFLIVCAVIAMRFLFADAADSRWELNAQIFVFFLSVAVVLTQRKKLDRPSSESHLIERLAVVAAMFVVVGGILWALMTVLLMYALRDAFNF